MSIDYVVRGRLFAFAKDFDKATVHACMHLTQAEIQFLVWALTEYKEHLERKSVEVKQLEWRVHLLRKEIWVNPMVYKELNAVKQKLAQEKAKHYVRHQTVCDSLLRRFKGMVDGRMLHTPFWVLQQLNQITSKQ